MCCACHVLPLIPYVLVNGIIFCLLYLKHAVPVFISSLQQSTTQKFPEPDMVILFIAWFHTEQVTQAIFYVSQYLVISKTLKLYYNIKWYTWISRYFSVHWLQVGWPLPKQATATSGLLKLNYMNGNPSPPTITKTDPFKKRKKPTLVPQQSFTSHKLQCCYLPAFHGNLT